MKKLGDFGSPCLWQKTSILLSAALSDNTGQDSEQQNCHSKINTPVLTLFFFFFF